ncbi:MAG: histidine phosphatase family protein [Nocardioides sp.]|nr:histidine phosphatase family protein [Nocardioides sp.]
MRRLVLLRHGQTEWNLAGRFQGHTDIALDETGVAQAERVAPAMAALDPVRLWSSDLVRASRTAEIVAAATGLEPVLDDRLREYDVGVRAGMTRDELRAQHPEVYLAMVSGAPGAVEGAETDEQVQRRVHSALQDFWESLGRGETGLVVMHGAALRTGLLAFLGWPVSLREQLRGLANCGWVELLESEDGRPQMVAYNRVVGG